MQEDQSGALLLQSIREPLGAIIGQIEGIEKKDSLRGRKPSLLDVLETIEADPDAGAMEFQPEAVQ